MPASKPRAVRLLAVRPAAAAGLVSIAIACAFLRAVDEVALQVGGLRSGVAIALVAIACGVLFGLWYPRRLIRRHLTRVAEPAQHGAAATVDASFSALVSAALALLLAATNALLVASVAWAEPWRAGVVANLVAAPGPLLAVSLVPIVFALALVGAAATTLLIALLGWQRVVVWPASDMAAFWMLCIGAAALGMAITLGLGSIRMAAFVALAAPLGASILAVGERSRKTVPVLPPRHSPRGARLVAPVAIAMLVGGAASLATLAAIPAALASPAGRVLLAVGLGGGLLAGAAAARWLLAALRADPLGPAAISACLSVLTVALFRGGGAVGALVTATVVAGLSGVAFANLGRMIARLLGPPQHAVRWLGSAATAGMVVAGFADVFTPPAAGSVARPPPVPQGVTLICSGMRLGSAVVSDLSVHPTNHSAWRVDLAATRLDAILLAADRDDAVPERQRRRAVRRAERALVEGGRIIFGGDGETYAVLAARLTGRPAWHVELDHAPGDSVELWVVGEDVSPWVELRCAGTGWRCRVEPWGGGRAQ